MKSLEYSDEFEFVFGKEQIIEAVAGSGRRKSVQFVLCNVLCDDSLSVFVNMENLINSIVQDVGQGL